MLQFNFLKVKQIVGKRELLTIKYHLDYRNVHKKREIPFLSFMQYFRSFKPRFKMKRNFSRMSKDTNITNHFCCCCILLHTECNFTLRGRGIVEICCGTSLIM